MATAQGKCKACGQEIIPFRHPVETINGKVYAVVGEFPGAIEIKMGLPFVGKSGNVLRQELARLEIDIDELGLGNLWPHAKNDDERCLDIGLGALLRALQPYKQVLFLGSDCSQTFFNENVTNVSGLWMESKLLPNKELMATVNPASLLKGGGIGEFRLALELFFGERKRKKLKWRKDLLKQLAAN